MRVINGILYTSGALAIAVSWVRWFFLYPDTSQLALGSGVGLCFLAFGYIYSRLLSLAGEIEELKKKVEGIIKIYTKEELE